MNVLLVENWWSLLIRGLLGIAVGIITFLWPTITLGALVLLFAAYAILDGVLALAGAAKAAREHDRWGALVLEGVVGLLAGMIAIARPAITATVLVYVIAAWAVLTGILEIGAAIRLRRHIEGEWLLGAFGLLSVLFGLAIAAMPGLGALTIALWIGAYAFVSGIVLTMLGIRLKTQSRRGDVDSRMAA